MSADVEEKYVIAQATEPLDSEGRFLNDRIRARFKEEILDICFFSRIIFIIFSNNIFYIFIIINGIKHATSSSTFINARSSNSWNRY